VRQPLSSPRDLSALRWPSALLALWLALVVAAPIGGATRAQVASGQPGSPAIGFETPANLADPVRGSTMGSAQGNRGKRVDRGAGTAAWVGARRHGDASAPRHDGTVEASQQVRPSLPAAGAGVGPATAAAGSAVRTARGRGPPVWVHP
jgi:hypothetical protein